MQLQHTWEHNLLDLATEAIHLHDEQPRAAMTFESDLLENAYGYCEHVTALHSRSFHLASGLLTEQKRRAAMRRHMAECPYKHPFGRALWRALF